MAHMSLDRPPILRPVGRTFALVLAALAVSVLALVPPAAGQLVINEIDYDQPSTDTAEFIEIKNTSGSSIDLSGYALELVNGTGGGAAVYDTIALPAVSLAAGDYFVVCANAANTPNCDLDVSPDSNLVQNGAPDAVALVLGVAIVDTVSYEGDTGAPYTEGSGAGLEDPGGTGDDFKSISRFPDGVDSGQNNADLSTRCISPGEANVADTTDCALPADVELVINEIDYDQPGTDFAEFVEIKNVGIGAVDLSAVAVVLVNGTGGGAAIYNTIALPAVSLAPGGYFVVCADAATTPNCDLDVSPDSNLIQNGAPDAVALTSGGSILDTVSYEGDTGAPYTEGSGAGLEDPGGTGDDFLGISRFPDGADSDVNNVDLSTRCITPGLANTADTSGCSLPEEAELVINEVDYDQPGTDTAEFVEIKNVGAGGVDLSAFSLVLVNGTGGGASIYNTIALPAVTLGPGEYFVVCGNAANTFGCDLDVTPDSNLVQNGAPDAVALVSGGSIVDTVSYEGDTGAPYTEGSGAGLEDPTGSGDDNKSISRFPDGVDTEVNNLDFSVRCATPGSANSADSSNCPSVGPPALVINEIDYDQPGTDTAEFIEIHNAGTGDADLTGVELLLVNGTGGGATVYQTFALPAVSLAAGDYFVVCADPATTLNCDLDASPDSNLIQNGSPDAAALVLGGVLLDAVSYEGDTAAPYTEGSGAGLEDSGSAGQDFRSIGRFPDGTDTNQNNVDLLGACITPGRPNTSLTVACTAAGPVLEIWEIQGAGLASPYAGQTAVTLANVVTAVGVDGFFMQTPPARIDGDVDTSDGIFVFTGGAPGVAAGDLVDVVGTAAEFFNFTEVSGFPDVTVVGSGPVPAPVVFDATVPSPDPAAPSCAIEFECYEGMYVEVEGGAVSGPNQRFGTDPIAEVHVVAGPVRAFREPGILYPGLPMLPVWDGNPEVFELDPDKLGLPNAIIPAGSSFSARGGLGFEFSGYELWASELTFDPATLPRPVRARDVGEYTVGTLNLFRLFDDVDDPPSMNSQGGVRDDEVVDAAEYATRRAKFCLYVSQVLGSPDVLAVEEAESLTVLQALANDLATDATCGAFVSYTAYLIEGNDIGTIDTGFLVRDTIQVDALTQLGATETLSVDGSLLHDRPPLLLEGAYTGGGGESPIKVMAVHNRSLGGIEDPADGPRVRQKRLEQAESIALKVQALEDADPDVPLVVLGDFNAFEFTDGYVDAVGHIQGDFVAADELVCQTNPCPDLVDPDLTNQVDLLPAGERYSFIFGGSAQVLDHALTSQGLAPFVRGAEYGRGNVDAALILLGDPSTPLRSSDHDGLVLYVAADSDQDGVPDDLDVCPGTEIPEGVPTVSLMPNHYALVDGDGVFDTVTPPGGGAGDVFTVDDTGGCSCEQIIDAQGLGQGHRKHGCSVEAMRDWVALVSP